MADFRRIKETYKQNPLCILKQLIPNGKIEGSDYVAQNPRRNDRRAGSFRIDITTGRFNDFATGDRGGDIIDLTAFIYDCNVTIAAARLNRLFFSSLAGDKFAVLEDLPAKRKKIDPNYIWSRSIKSEDHGYLRKKCINSGNARINVYQGKKQLVIPLIDSIPNKDLKGLQFIREDGSKSFPLPFRGLFHVASGGKCDLGIIIAEGYATARSIFEATGLFTIAAMSACNIKAVALKIRELFPYSAIVIAADNDAAGRRAAEEILQALGCNVQIIYPTNGKDFNDMLVKVGQDSLKFHILSSIKTETVYD